MKNIYKITFFILFFSILSGCGSDNPVTNPPASNEVIVSSNAKLIPPLDFQNSIVSFSTDSSLITLRQGVASVNSLANGNVLVTENGSGMIRKINSIQTQNGNVILNTSRAALTDVFQKLNLSFDKQLSASDTTSITPGDSVTITRIKRDAVNLIDITLSFQKQLNGVYVSGEITFSISYHVDIRINNFTLQSGTEVSFTPIASVRLNAGLGALSMYETKVKLFDVNFQSFVVPIGGWPVVFTPNNSIYLKFDAEGRVTATAEVTSSIQTTTGVTYNNNIWTTFVNESHNFSFVPPLPNLSIEADAKVSLENEVTLRIYGIVGPYISVGPYLNLGVSVTPPIKAELYGGIEGSIGVRVIIFGYQLANYENLIAIAIRQKLWELALSGKISGSVRQAGNFVPISGCQIQAKRNGQIIETGTSLSDGTYEVSLPAASNYEVIYSKTGYISANYFNVNVQTFNTTYIETILQVQNSTMPGSISGILTNATTGLGVQGISLKLRSGYNNTSGTVVTTTTTLSGGSYTFNNVQPGNYTVEASGTGYNTTYFSVYCVGGTNSEIKMQQLL
ncbi:MAG: carboxypeptidase regulatory-like domain-containing protein [Ignavibacteria bacterium]|nr:carboxypeptidase regulatory-like domain-containing protein [Ignavibacteria bacterium]